MEAFYTYFQIFLLKSLLCCFRQQVLMEQENLEEMKEREERLAQIEVKYILKVNPMLVFHHSV